VEVGGSFIDEEVAWSSRCGDFSCYYNLYYFQGSTVKASLTTLVSLLRSAQEIGASKTVVTVGTPGFLELAFWFFSAVL
jgi:hypothetical protein